MKAAYTGCETLTFQDYTDLDTGRTLLAEPGGAYDIAPASGHQVPDVPEGWFTPVEATSADSTEVQEVTPETVEADEASAEPEPDDEG